MKEESQNIPFNFDIKENEDSSEENQDESENSQNYSLDDRRKQNNNLFGFIPWKSSVAHRPLESRSEVVRNLYQDTPKLTEDGFLFKRFFFF